MKQVSIILVLAAFVIAAAAQKPGDVLATANGQSFKLSDLSADIQKDVADLPVNLAKSRTVLLEQMTTERLLRVEAKARGISFGKLLSDTKAKAANPTDSEVKTFYDANLDKMQGSSLEQAKASIIAYLRSGAEQEAVKQLVAELRTRYKAVGGKDVNAAGVAPADVVMTVAGSPITAKEFEDYARIPLFLARRELAGAIVSELRERVYDTLVAAEAKSLGIEPGALIGREITDKLKDYTEAEQTALRLSLERRLFTKYQVKTLYSMPETPVESVSADGEPSIGPATAPVTAIMFADLQCSASAATHPLLKEAMAAYPGKVRLVVRNFPLESIHPNAFQAARAAGAANAQGKFFEYIDLLYKNQNALDADSLKKYAAQIGLNAQQFALDFNADRMAAEVRKDIADGDALGINSTPTIFINGRRVFNLTLDGFRAAIDQALTGK